MREWARKVDELLPLLREHEGKALPRIGDSSFWRKWREGYSFLVDLIQNAIGIGIEASTGTLESELAISVDWALANADAATWARRYSGQLIRGMVETDKRNVRETLTAWIEADETFEDLVTRMRNIVGSETRARTIAATEATRSYAQGQVIGWRGAGLVTDDMMDRADAEGVVPPLHPNCRCWLTLDPDRGLRFNTARDELVDVVHCAPLAGRIVVPIEVPA